MSLPFLLLAATLTPIGSTTLDSPTTQEALKKLDFLTGSYEGSTTFTINGSNVKAPTRTKGESAIKDSYVEVKINYNLSGVQSEARMLITYVPAEKLYKSWWFDSISPSVVSQSGKLVGDSLVLETEPNVSGEIVRSTWKPASNGMAAIVESGSKDKFTTLVDSILTRAKGRI